MIRSYIGGGWSSPIHYISGLTDIIFELLNLGKVNNKLHTLVVSKIPLLVFHLCGCSWLCMSMDACSELLMNAMSPSEPESKSTFHILLHDSNLPFSWGIAAVAVVKPLPFTTCWHEVECIKFGFATLIGTTCDVFTLFCFILDELLSLFLDKRNLLMLQQLDPTSQSESLELESE